MKNPSRDQLSRSLDRRTKHLMIQTLESFENLFSDLEGSRDYDVFKSGVRTAFNDVMRAQRDEVRDYDIEYRPLHIQADNSLMLTRTFLMAVQNVKFGFNSSDSPFVTFQAHIDKIEVLNALRLELECGVLITVDDFVFLKIVGLESCVSSVLPCMDKYRLHNEVRKQYLEWRNKLVKKYCDG